MEWTAWWGETGSQQRGIQSKEEKDSKTNDGWEASTVQDMQYEMDNANHDDETKWLLPAYRTWRTSLISASKTSKASMDLSAKCWMH